MDWTDYFSRQHLLAYSIIFLSRSDGNGCHRGSRDRGGGGFGGDNGGSSSRHRCVRSATGSSRAAGDAGAPRRRRGCIGSRVGSRRRTPHRPQIDVVGVVASVAGVGQGTCPCAPSDVSIRSHHAVEHASGGADVTQVHFAGCQRRHAGHRRKGWTGGYECIYAQIPDLRPQKYSE